MTPPARDRVTPMAYYNEIDPYCCRVLRKQIAAGNLPAGDVDERDIRDVRTSDLVGYGAIHLFAGIGGIPLGLRMAGMADDFPIITGGFPCQPHAQGGLRLASADERDLWPEFYRIIRGTRRAWVLAENVSGLLSSEGGRFFGRVLSDLAAGGFNAEWDCLPASFVGGVHQRERVYLVAYANPIDGQTRLGHQSDGAATIFRPRAEDRDAVWLQAPDLAPRGDDGISTELYRPRVEALGNAVVPHMIAYVARQIMEATI